MKVFTFELEGSILSELHFEYRFVPNAKMFTD